MKTPKSTILVLILLTVLLAYGCSSKSDTERTADDVRAGTQGIIVNFLPNNPPSKVRLDPNSRIFDVVLELNNKGAYPQLEDTPKGSVTGKVYLSGYDTKLIRFDPQESVDLSKLALYGKSIINPVGGTDIATFKGTIGNLNVEQYNPTLLATLCYDYQTIAQPSVCIDPEPFSTINHRKVCQVSDTTLDSQGAPVAVVKIDEEAAASKTQFKITIRNIGGGDIIKWESGNKCNPFSSEKLKREDVDKVLFEARIGDEPLQCYPFIDGEIKSTVGYVRLINGEGFVICELFKSSNFGYAGGNSAYLTPLKLRLGYVYKTTAEKKIEITNEEVNNDIVPDISPSGGQSNPNVRIA